ncbi:MAG TPA: sigma factor-like helix-turn-helix DNA-binding protein [Candidatus Limnocylindrales bacterium]|nr:sigma factor-like helix-turn-helix DNA-binding protein [Candidatus Limnocylindrales bacterium]
MTVKPRSRLTEAQRQMVAEALGYAERTIRRACKLRGQSDDFRSAVAERICCLIPSFDAARSGLRAWAICQAKYAIKDELRRLLPAGRRHRDVKVYSVSWYYTGPLEDGGDSPINDSLHSYLAVWDDPDAPALSADAIHHLTRSLSAEKRHILLGSIVEGRTLKSLGADLGLSASRACQLRRGAIEFIRKHRTP